jgi:hypothetical protein
MEVHLKILGYLFVILSIAHAFFPKYFNWKQELNQVSLINKQMMQVHTFFVALVVLGIGLLNIFYCDRLLTTDLGKTICFGLFIFWLTRLLFQFFVYSTKLWRGKKFETFIHILFSIFWMYCTWVYLMAWLCD